MKNKLSKISNYYIYHLKLHTKLIISHLVLIAVPTLFIFYFIYSQMYEIIVSDTIRSEHALSEQTVGTLEATLGHISNIAVTLKDNFPASENPSSFQKTVSSLMDDDSINAIKVYMDVPSDMPAANIFLPLIEARGTYWNGIFSSSDITSLFCPTFYLSPHEIESYGDMAYINKVTYDYMANNSTAYIVIYFDKETLDYILKQNISLNNSVSYIINERDSLVSASDASLVGAYYMNYQTVKTSPSGTNTFVTKTVLDEKVYTANYKIEGTDWYLVTVLPANSLLAKGNALIIQFVIFYLLLITLAFITTSRLSHSISKRISSVITQMRNVRYGKPEPMETDIQKDEIGDLIETYNYMSEQINLLLDKEAEAAKKMRTSEFNALQAQINPHFLYNTLDMISWLSKSGKNEDVTTAVQALSKFYKLTLSKKGTVSTIEQELEHISLFVQIQNMRFNNKINLIIDVSDSLMDYEIPKLTFQPIVENSILHGILEKDINEGNIVITAWMANDMIVFLISDDGIGMKPSQVEKILLGNMTENKGSNIGVYNTHQRLQLLYGGDFGLTYSSTLGIGTDVKLRLPARKRGF